MKQIITVCVGQCGIRCATSLFTLIQNERILSQNSDTCESFFSETRQGGRQARFIAVDNDTSEIDKLMLTDIGRTVPLENMMFSGRLANGNYAKARTQCLPEVQEILHDGIRRQLEKCESPQLIQLHNSLGGGTGTALGYSVLQYPFWLKSTISVMPASKLSNSLIEPYNATLALRDLFHNCNQSLLFDNDSLHSHLKIAQFQEKPKFEELNQLIVDALDDFTAADRYRRGESMRKRMMSMVPFPDLHFFGYSMGGPTSFGDKLELERTFLDFHNSKFGLSGVNKMGVYVGMNVIVRGNTAQSPYFNIKLKRLKDKLVEKYRYNHSRMEFWSGLDGLYTNTCPASNRGAAKSTSMSCVFNNQSISQPIQKITDECQKLYFKKAFLHLFQSNGMEMDQINESLGDLNGLLYEYNHLSSHNYCGGEEEDDSDCC